jgi:thiamine biosynthesis lipoprotein
MPDPARLAEARALVGYHKLHLDAAERTVRLDHPGMQLDLGGIAKGYAADRAIELIRLEGIASALVAAGGDVVVSAAPPGSRGWRVAVAPLTKSSAQRPRRLLLNNAAVSTSGDAEQFVEIDGKRYSHIVDPRTGIGLLGRRSVTVIADDGVTADSLATAVCVLGPVKGLKLVDRTPGTTASLVIAEGRRIRRIQSRGFPAARKAPGRRTPRNPNDSGYFLSNSSAMIVSNSSTAAAGILIIKP